MNSAITRNESFILPLLIRTCGGNYIYDPCTNKFLTVAGDFFDAILRAFGTTVKKGMVVFPRNSSTRQQWNELRLPEKHQTTLQEFRSRGYLRTPNYRVLPFPKSVSDKTETSKKNKTAAHLIIELTDA